MSNLSFRTLLYFRENLFKYWNLLPPAIPHGQLREMACVLSRPVAKLILIDYIAAFECYICRTQFTIIFHRQCHGFSISCNNSGNPYVPL